MSPHFLTCGNAPDVNDYVLNFMLYFQIISKVQFFSICFQIFDFFKQRIEEQYPMPDYNLDAYQQAREAHEVGMRGVMLIWPEKHMR